ncbi:MAG: hypothetical protein KGO96_14345 [Elusimicrobia bacterium]|nr:hypothetical protein [Elusimicrobiota bacterium]MDE2427075.1 hypothetical protein [Elusimicrobiota bacterium]
MKIGKYVGVLIGVLALCWAVIGLGAKKSLAADAAGKFVCADYDNNSFLYKSNVDVYMRQSCDTSKPFSVAGEGGDAPTFLVCCTIKQ